MRARAYADAGADAVLIHSKAHDFDELPRLPRAGTAAVPLVAVPTTYARRRHRRARRRRLPLVIFANQALRAAIRAMRDALAALRRDGAARRSVDDRIVPLEDVYELVGVPELKGTSARFLPAARTRSPPSSSPPASSRELCRSPTTGPRRMLDVQGQDASSSARSRRCNASGIKDIAVVRGYKKEAVSCPSVRYVRQRPLSPRPASSRRCSAPRDELGGRFVFLYGDILFDAVDPRDACCAPAATWCWSSTAPSPTRARRRAAAAGPLDLVVTEPRAARATASSPPERRQPRAAHRPGASRRREAHGEFIGMAMFSAARRARGCARSMRRADGDTAARSRKRPRASTRPHRPRCRR